MLRGIMIFMIKTTAPTKRRIKVNVVSESELTVKGHGVHTAYVELANALAKRKDIELSINSKSSFVDIVHVHTVGFFALRRLLFTKGKKVITAHLVPDSFIGSFRAAGYWKPIGKWWLKFFYSRADLVLACSGMVRDELESGMGLKNVGLMYNTVNMASYVGSKDECAAARQSLGIDEDAFVVIGNGQVQPRKRLDTFFAIAKALPDVRFFWIGGIPFKHLGADYGGMQKLIASAPKNVSMTGMISLEEVRKYYLVADTFVLPAAQENHPMSVLEAAGAGLPIVLRDIPEYDDTFRGYALMAKDDQSFIEHIDNLQKKSEVYKKAKQGADYIARRFDSSKGADQAVDYYRSLL